MNCYWGMVTIGYWLNIVWPSPKIFQAFSPWPIGPSLCRGVLAVLRWTFVVSPKKNTRFGGHKSRFGTWDWTWTSKFMIFAAPDMKWYESFCAKSGLHHVQTIFFLKAFQWVSENPVHKGSHPAKPFRPFWIHPENLSSDKFQTGNDVLVGMFPP